MAEASKVLDTYISGLKAHDVQLVASAVSEELAFVTPRRILTKSQFLAMLEALYAAFPDWRYEHSPPEENGQLIAIRWRQGGTHLGTLALPGYEPVAPTGRTVTIPDQYFYYRLGDRYIEAIRPDAVPGGAPEGIFEQLGVSISH